MIQPHPHEIRLARAMPDGWVYRIAGGFSPDEAVPAEAIIGAWKVGEDGIIDGAFIANDRYDPARHPA